MLSIDVNRKKACDLNYQAQATYLLSRVFRQKDAFHVSSSIEVKVSSNVDKLRLERLDSKMMQQVAKLHNVVQMVLLCPTVMLYVTYNSQTTNAAQIARMLYAHL